MSFEIYYIECKRSAAQKIILKAESLATYAMSSYDYVSYNGTKIMPITLQAKSNKLHSVLFGLIIPILSPLFNPKFSKDFESNAVIW